LLPLEHELGRARLSIALLDSALATVASVARHACLLTHHLDRARLLYLELHVILSLCFLLQAFDAHLFAHGLPVKVDSGKIPGRLILVLLYVEHERVREAVTIKLAVMPVIDRQVSDALVRFIDRFTVGQVA
jgi:hypothetical protein